MRSPEGLRLRPKNPLRVSPRDPDQRVTLPLDFPLGGVTLSPKTPSAGLRP